MRKISLIPPLDADTEETREYDGMCFRCKRPTMGVLPLFFMRTDVRTYYIHVRCPQDDEV